MADISIPVARPVAFPPKFFGAPMIPAMITFFLTMGGVMATFAFASNKLYGLMAFFLWPIVQGVWIGIGFMYPHITQQAIAYFKATKRPRNIWRGDRKTFYAR